MTFIIGNDHLFEITSGTLEPNGLDIVEDLMWFPETYVCNMYLLDYGPRTRKVVSVDAGVITFDQPHELEVGDTVHVWTMAGLKSLWGEQEIATVPDEYSITLVSAFTSTDWKSGGTIRKVIYGPQSMETITYGTTNRLLHVIPSSVDLQEGRNYVIVVHAYDVPAGGGNDFEMYYEQLHTAVQEVL